jgi:hypothetical protein
MVQINLKHRLNSTPDFKKLEFGRGTRKDLTKFASRKTSENAHAGG